MEEVSNKKRRKCWQFISRLVKVGPILGVFLELPRPTEALQSWSLHQFQTCSAKVLES